MLGATSRPNRNIKAAVIRPMVMVLVPLYYLPGKVAPSGRRGTQRFFMAVGQGR